jgi:hypothetical protein
MAIVDAMKVVIKRSLHAIQKKIKGPTKEFNAN